MSDDPCAASQDGSALPPHELRVVHESGTRSASTSDLAVLSELVPSTDSETHTRSSERNPAIPVAATEFSENGADETRQLQLTSRQLELTSLTDVHDKVFLNSSRPAWTDDDVAGCLIPDKDTFDGARRLTMDVLDPSNGEIVKMSGKRGRRMPGQWTYGWVDQLEELVMDTDMTGTPTRLLLLLCSRLQLRLPDNDSPIRHGQVLARRVELARTLGVSREAVRKAISTAMAGGWIVEVPPTIRTHESIFYLNPWLFFRGSVHERRDATTLWDDITASLDVSQNAVDSLAADSDSPSTVMDLTIKDPYSEPT